MKLICWVIILPMFGGAWLFSRRFREERRRNQATLAARAKEVEAAAESQTLLRRGEAHGNVPDRATSIAA